MREFGIRGDDLRLELSVKVTVRRQTLHQLGDFTEFPYGTIAKLLFVEHKKVVYRRLRDFSSEVGEPKQKATEVRRLAHLDLQLAR